MYTLGNVYTSSLHSAGTWSSPETTGPRPPPCAGFSFTKIDLSRVVLFGGEQGTGPGLFYPSHLIYNEVHILDMDSLVNICVELIFLPNIAISPQHWSGAILPSSPTDLWPRGRFSHSACALFAPTSSSAAEGSSKEIPHSDMIAGQYKPKLFVLWGAGSTLSPMSDAWILDVNNMTWKPVMTCTFYLYVIYFLGVYHKYSASVCNLR